MKYLILFVIALTMLSSCKKDEVESPLSIAGYWELKYSSGRWEPHALSVLIPPGRRLIFFTETEYRSFRDSVLVSNGRYKLVKSSATLGREKYKTRIIFNDNASNKTYVKVAGRELFICSTTDGTSSAADVYERIDLP